MKTFYSQFKNLGAEPRETRIDHSALPQVLRQKFQIAEDLADQDSILSKLRFEALTPGMMMNEVVRTPQDNVTPVQALIANFSFWHRATVEQPAANFRP